MLYEVITLANVRILPETRLFLINGKDMLKNVLILDAPSVLETFSSSSSTINVITSYSIHYTKLYDSCPGNGVGSSFS